MTDMTKPDPAKPDPAKPDPAKPDPAKPHPGNHEPASDDAAAMKNGIKPGPAPSATQIRPAGADAMRDTPEDWDKTDEALDESFPASDPPAKY